MSPQNASPNCSGLLERGGQAERQMEEEAGHDHRLCNQDLSSFLLLGGCCRHECWSLGFGIISRFLPKVQQT
jgi:hypothetical protein